MSAEPQVSVVMAAYNAERFLRAAVESVLRQTFGDWELILVDDGSTDASPQILSSFSDPRIILLRNSSNRGLPASLNRGLRAARAPLVARLDADDIAASGRLERQVTVMRNRPELDVLGTWTTEIDAEDRPIGEFSFPPSEALIRWGMTITNVIYHPTVLMRRERLEAIGGYHEWVEYAEDYDLFTRVLISGGRITMLPERLVRYRRVPGQISHARVEQQQRDGLGVRQRYLGWLVGDEPPIEVVEAASRLEVANGDPPEPGVLDEALALVRRIRRRCVERASRPDAGEISWRIRAALLYHAGQLRKNRRTSEAMRVWWEAARCGPDAWRRQDVWEEAARLARAGR